MDKLPEMPDHVRKYYDYYLALGPERSLNKVYQDLGEYSYPAVRKWSIKYKWRERLARDLGELSDVDLELDSKSLNRDTLKTIDKIIKSIQNRPEKTEKDAAALYKLIELRARIAQKIDEAEEKNRLKIAGDFVQKLVAALEEELANVEIVEAKTKS